MKECTLFAWKWGSQSIVLYWAIAFCSRKDYVFACREISWGVRMYSLRKPLLDVFFQVSSEGPTMDELVPLIIMVGAVVLWPRQWRIGQDRLWASNAWLIFEGVEYFVDRKFQRYESLYWPIDLVWTWWEYRELLLLIKRLPQMSIWSMVESFANRFWFCSIIARLSEVVGGSLHRLI